jgi:diacylglycerol kinase family enzyme
MVTHSALRLLRTEAQRQGFAVLLNANARAVTDGVRERLEHVVPRQDLFLSQSAEDAQAIAETVVARGYRTVFTGGGDGTFVGWVNQILDRTERHGAAAPRFGILPLGTGNAVAGVVGARPEALVDHLAAYATGAVRHTKRLRLVSCDGRRTPFAGVGVDAAVINDYDWFKERLGGTVFRRLASGIPGYALSAALRTAPRYLATRGAAYCEIVNAGRPAYRLDRSGRATGRSIAQGDLLYAGPCMMAAASTVPFYGFGMRAFPFAEACPGMLQLRVVTALSVPSVLFNLPRIWSCDFAHDGLLDFHAERVTVSFERPMPLEVGGDAEGCRQEVTFGVAPGQLELVDFTPRPSRPTLVN